MCLDPILKFVLDLLRSITKKLVLHEKSNYGISIDLFVHHKSENSHHGGTSVVQFDGTLSELGLFAEGVPSEVESVTEVSLNSASPVTSFITKSSRRPMKRTICPSPSLGKASSPKKAAAPSETMPFLRKEWHRLRKK